MTTDTRGEKYADGGIASVEVFYPDPERIKRINAEWAMREAETSGEQRTILREIIRESAALVRSSKEVRDEALRMRFLTQEEIDRIMAGDVVE